MTTMTEQLLPCPFCGGASTTDAYDRGINIGCGSCGYSRHFPGLLQTVPNDKPIAQYRNGAGGITEIPASEATEFYHADAHERAADAWNRRTTIQPVAVPEPVGYVSNYAMEMLKAGRPITVTIGVSLSAIHTRPIYTAAPAQAAPDVVNETPEITRLRLAMEEAMAKAAAKPYGTRGWKAAERAYGDAVVAYGYAVASRDWRPVESSTDSQKGGA